MVPAGRLPPPTTRPETTAARVSDAPAVGPAPPDSPYYPAVTRPPEQTGILMDALRTTEIGPWLDANRINIGGWTEINFTASSASRTNSPLGFNYAANEFQLNQNWIRVERAVSERAAGPSFGYRFDAILPGTDYRYTLVDGLFDGQDGKYGVDLPQFYGDVLFPGVLQGLTVRAGRFESLIGAESIETVRTPFLSRSYTFLYSPFTHTGLLSTLNVNDFWRVEAGVVTGSYVFFGGGAQPTFIGAVGWNLPEDRNSLKFSVILGSGDYDAAHRLNRPQILDLVFAHKFNEQLRWTIEALYGWQHEVPFLGTVNWFGVVNYLAYELNDRWTLNGRVEFFDDLDGQLTGFKGLYTAVTGGVTWQPRKWVLIRPEVRMDVNSNTKAFEGDNSLFTAALDLVFVW